MRLLAGTLACSLVLATATAAGAAAQQTLAPPGNSGVDQYFETVPGAGGSVGVRRPPPSTSTSAPTTSTAAGGAPGAGAAARLRTLGRFGADGRAAAAVAAATGPAAPRKTAAGGSAPSTAAPSFVAPPRPTGSLSALLTVLGGSDHGGLGLAFPVALAAALAGALVLLAARRRSRSSG